MNGADGIAVLLILLRRDQATPTSAPAETVLASIGYQQSHGSKVLLQRDPCGIPRADDPARSDVSKP
jgi:hypothetical protein